MRAFDLLVIVGILLVATAIGLMTNAMFQTAFRILLFSSAAAGIVALWWPRRRARLRNKRH